MTLGLQDPHSVGTNLWETLKVNCIPSLNLSVIFQLSASSRCFLSSCVKTKCKIGFKCYCALKLGNSLKMSFVVVMRCSMYFNEAHQGDSGGVGNWSRGTPINID